MATVLDRPTVELLREELPERRIGVDRVAGIVRAALERGSWPRPYVQNADLTEIATRMLRFLEPAFTDAGVTAELTSRATVTAACDPGMVEQILLNLLKNAIEALSPGNSVQITT